MKRLLVLCSVFAFSLVLPWSGLAQTFDKGHRILLNHGVQSFALSIKSDVFHIDTVKNANFTGVMWVWGEYDNSLLGPAPGYRWGRWVADPGQTGLPNLADMPPTLSPVDERPYMPNLVALALGDEQDFNNPTIRANMASWYAAVRDNYPDTILFCNNWGYQILDGNLEDYINTSHPDMLSMDTYEFVTGNSLTPGGSPYNLYHGMRQLRAFACGHGLPYQLYTQTYHSTGDNRRSPSDSELRLNYFAGVVFGFTSFVNFTYNTGASSLFTSPGGDSYPTPLYTTMTDINARLKKLSPALTRLQPARNFIGGYDASMMYVPGQHMVSGVATTNSAPDGDFLVYPAAFSSHFMTNDPYIKGVTVTYSGTKNDGLKGDVWMMWFKVLDESLDGDATGQIYVMILNGLSDPTGSGADCHQSVRLNYLDTPQTHNLLVWNQQTGAVDTVACPLISTRRQPTFELDGGEMVLFKFDTGAPFVGTPTAAKGWELYD